MKKMLFKKNLIYIWLLLAIILEFCNTFMEFDNMSTYASTATTNVTLSNPVDVTIPTEEELLAKMSNSEKFLYYLNRDGLIAHAGGVINNIPGTNSLEALNYSYERGLRVIEVDFDYTSDNHLVLAHGFTEQDYQIKMGIPYNKKNPIMNYNTFKKTKLFGKYTTVDIETLIDFMKKHNDVYIIPDIKKGDNIDIVKRTYTDIIKAANNDKSILNRIIGTYLNTKAYNAVKSIYRFDINSLHYRTSEKMEASINSIDSFYKYCFVNNFQLIIMDKELFTTEAARYYSNKNIAIALFSAGSQSVIDKYLKMGATAIMTNN